MITAILAGGNSARFGSDKARLVVAGERLLERTARLVSPFGPLVVVGRELPADWSGPPATVFMVDAQRGDGPLSGLVTALEMAIKIGHDEVLLLPCDLPRLDYGAVRWLAGLTPGPGGVATVVEGFPQPLASRYGIACLAMAKDRLVGNARSLQALIRDSGLKQVEIPMEFRLAFRGCNTPAEWEAGK